MSSSDPFDNATRAAVSEHMAAVFVKFPSVSIKAGTEIANQVVSYVSQYSFKKKNRSSSIYT